MFVHLSIGELAEPGFSQGFFSISVTLWSLGPLPLSPMVLIHTSCFFLAHRIPISSKDRSSSVHSLIVVVLTRFWVV